MAQTPIINSQASLALTQYFPLNGVFPPRDSGGDGFYLGDIATFAGNFAPTGLVASGQLLPINQDTAVFSLIGTFYGGNGTTNFAIPDLDGITMIGSGQGPGLAPVDVGEQIGSSTVTLTNAQLPPDIGGTSQPFDNYQPSLTITYGIALEGIFPSRDGGASPDLRTLGMVVPFAGNFATGGFAECDGQLLSISQNTALFSILGTTYGGDGITTFALPDLRDRDIIGSSATEPEGTKAGQADVGLTNAQTPNGLGNTVAPFNNQEPSLSMEYLIALQGIFPTQGGNQSASTPFLGQIVNFAGNFTPDGWAQCDGQLLLISENTALFEVIGTTYGGDGITTFALPDLRDRTVVGAGGSESLGEESGTNSVTITTANLASVTINSSFPTGYSLDPTDLTLNIGGAAVIGGTGVTTTASHASIVNNLGKIQATGFAAGITLPDGGTINNGSTLNHTALISGHTGIVLQGTGTVTNFGTITGTAGTAISFNAAGARLIEEGSGVLNGAVVGGGGTLELGGKAGAGTLSGLGGNLLKGFATVTVDKGATWNLSGASTIAAGAVLNNSGTLDLLAQLGNSGQVNNLASATLALKGDFGIGNTGQFSNAGLLEKVSGTGTSIIRTGTASLTSSGTIDVESGTLELTGATVGITGAIKGAGTIELATGATTLGTGTSLTVAALTIAGTGADVTVAHTLSYAGTFSAGTGTELTIGAGDIFTLSGPASFFRDTVDGAGRLATTGATAVSVVTLGGTAQWYNAGTLTETSTLTIGDSAGNKAAFVNQATGVFNLAGNAGIAIGTAATSTFTNQGAVAKTGGGMGTIVMAVANSGSLGVSSGTLNLLGQVTNSGTVFSLAGTTLALADNVSITTTSGGAFSNAGLFEKLAGPGTSIVRTGTASLTSSGTIDVLGGTLELIGATIGITGKIEGAGMIEFGAGAATLGAGSSLTVAALTIAGTGAHVTAARTLAYAGAFSAGSGTELTVATGDTFTLSGPASFFRDTVDGAGRLTTKGATAVNLVTLGGTAQWYNAGTLTETATLTIGDSTGDTATFVNQATGVFDLAGNAGIGIGTASTSSFTNQGLLAKTAGGTGVIAVAVANTGTLESASTLDLQKAVTGTGGTLRIDAGKAIQADAAVSAGQTVDFNGGGDKLVLTDAAHFAAKLSNFGAGDKLDLREFAPASTTLAYVENAAHTAGTLTVTDGALQAKIALLGDFTATAFHAASDGVPGGSYVTYTPPPAPMLIAAPHT